MATQTQGSKENGSLGKDPQDALARSQASSTSGNKSFPTPVTIPSWHRALEGPSKSQHKSAGMWTQWCCQGIYQMLTEPRKFRRVKSVWKTEMKKLSRVYMRRENGSNIDGLNKKHNLLILELQIETGTVKWGTQILPDNISGQKKFKLSQAGLPQITVFKISTFT